MILLLLLLKKNFALVVVTCRFDSMRHAFNNFFKLSDFCFIGFIDFFFVFRPTYLQRKMCVHMRHCVWLSFFSLSSVWGEAEWSRRNYAISNLFNSINERNFYLLHFCVPHSTFAHTFLLSPSLFLSLFFSLTHIT